MRFGRIMAGAGAVALSVAGGLAVSSVGATEHVVKRVAGSPRPASSWGGAFTPAAADPRLAAVFARSGIDPTGFRFTPAEPRRGDRTVTVTVRMRTNRPSVAALSAPARVEAASAGQAPASGIAPIAYNLGAAVGWKRFALSGDVSKVDLGTTPGSRESVGVGISYAATRRLTGQVHASSDRPLTGNSVAQLSTDVPSYSIDVGGAYKLTRNLDVTAGVRYRADRDRLDRALDERRESQAVYLGTAFRF